MKRPKSLAGTSRTSTLVRRTRLRKQSKKRWTVQKLDDLCRKVVFQRDGLACVRCNGVGNYYEREMSDGTVKLVATGIHWAHVDSSRYHSTRWLPENSLALCPRCHRWWHDFPAESGPWWREMFPDRANIVSIVRRSGIVPPKAQIAERLTAILEGREVA